MICEDHFENNMKKEKILGVVLLLSLLWSSVLANPIFRQIGLSDDVMVVTVNGTQVCQVDGEHYQVYEELPTKDPCEYCTCQPPGIACEVIKCEHKEGCRSLQRSGLCCPEYVCDCELNGKIYRNGDRITDHLDPCEDCYCVTGMVTCSVIQCSPLKDGCISVPVRGKCCPNYECPEVDQQDTKIEESETSANITTEVSPEDDATNDSEDVILATTQTPVLEDDPNADYTEVYKHAVTEVTLPESDGKTGENEILAEISFLEDNINSDDEEASESTTPKTFVVKNAVKTEETDTTTSPVDDEVTETIENYSGDITTRSPVYDVERVDVKEEIRTPDTFSESDAYTEVSGSEQTTEISGQVLEAEVGENANVREEKPESITEVKAETITESSLIDTTVGTEETASINERYISTDKEVIPSTQAPDEEKYQQMYLSALLEERISQSQEKDPSTFESDDLEASEIVASTVSAYSEYSQIETTTLANEETKETGVVEVQTSEEFLRDSEVSTQKTSDDETKVATESAIINRKDEEEIGQSSAITSWQEGVQTTEIPFRDEIKTTEINSPVTESEVVSKIYRSDIEELKNKLIISVKAESTLPVIEEKNFQTTKIESRTDEYEPTTEVSHSDASDDDKEDFETSSFIATSPNPDSYFFYREEFATIANEDQTETPSTLSPEDRQKNKANEYWLNMMEGHSNPANNASETTHEDNVLEEQEKSLKRDEETTAFSLLSDETTRLYLRSDLLFSEEGATAEANDFEHLATTEKISEQRDEDEATTVSATSTSRLDAGYYQDTIDESVDESVTTELPIQTAGVRESEVTNETPSGIENKIADNNLEAEITTQPVSTISSEDIETITETAVVKINKYDLKALSDSKEDKSSIYQKEDLEEERLPEIESKTESTVPETTEISNELENKTDENFGISRKPVNESDPSAEKDTKTQEQVDEIPSRDQADILTDVQLASAPKPGKPQRIEQQLSHLARKFGKLGLRPVLRRRGKDDIKRRRVHHIRDRKAFLKRV